MFANLFAPYQHVLWISAALIILSPLLAVPVFVLTHAFLVVTSGVTQSTGLLTEEAHVGAIFMTFSVCHPEVAVFVVIGTCLLALLASFLAVGVHPSGIILTLAHGGPGGAVLVVVFTVT